MSDWFKCGDEDGNDQGTDLVRPICPKSATQDWARIRRSQHSKWLPNNRLLIVGQNVVELIGIFELMLYSEPLFTYFCCLASDPQALRAHGTVFFGDDQLFAQGSEWKHLTLRCGCRPLTLHLQHVGVAPNLDHPSINAPLLAKLI